MTPIMLRKTNSNLIRYVGVLGLRCDYQSYNSRWYNVKDTPCWHEINCYHWRNLYSLHL